MVPIQNTKIVSLISPVAIKDNAAWVTAEIDTLGYDYITLVFNIGATDIAIADLQVTESSTAGSGHADITGATFAPSATNDNTTWAIELDLRKRMRYIDVDATSGNGTAGTYMSGVAILSRAGEGVETAAERGLAGLVQL